MCFVFAFVQCRVHHHFPDGVKRGRVLAQTTYTRDSLHSTKLLSIVTKQERHNHTTPCHIPYHIIPCNVMLRFRVRADEGVNFTPSKRSRQHDFSLRCTRYLPLFQALECTVPHVYYHDRRFLPSSLPRHRLLIKASNAHTPTPTHNTPISRERGSTVVDRVWSPRTHSLPNSPRAYFLQPRHQRGPKHRAHFTRSHRKTQRR